MSATDVAAAIDADVVVVTEFATPTIDVPLEQWLAATTAARDAGYGFFDWLSAYDDGEAGLAVVVHVWAVARREGLSIRTRVARDGGRLPTLTGVWAGADWHERETYEMFGIVAEGHPNLVPLLLPDGFEGTPLRKEFVLASRVAKAWPGEKEPGESDAHREAPAGEPTAAPRRARRPMRPPGVPEPGTWGPAS